MAEMTVVRVECRGANLELFSDHHSPIILVSSAAGTGKTVAALYKTHLACLANPGTRALIQPGSKLRVRVVLPDGTELAATGKRVEMPGMEFVKVRDGKIVVDNLYYDNLAVAAQFGLLPQPATTSRGEVAASATRPRSTGASRHHLHSTADAR